MNLEQLQKDLDAAGIDPETGEVNEELINQGEENVASESDRIEEGTELGEADSGELEGSEPEGSGEHDESSSEPSEDELALLEEVDEGKGMVEVPASVLKKLKKQKKEALDARDEARTTLEEQRNAALQSQIESKDQIINQLALQGQPAQDTDPEPDKTLDYEEWTEWRMRKQDAQIQELTTAVQQTSQVTNMQTAQNTITQMEEVYSSINPEFKSKKEQYIKAIAASIVISQPTATLEERQAMAKDEFAYQASNMQPGVNIMEAFDNMFNEMGIEGKKETTTAKPDIKTAAENAKKNKTVSNKGAKTSPGAGQILPTQEEYLNMSRAQVKDWKTKHNIKDKDWKAHTLSLAKTAAINEGSDKQVLMG